VCVSLFSFFGKGVFCVAKANVKENIMIRFW